jgi:hypothetical protein
MSLASIYIDSVINRMNSYKVLGEKTFDQLAEEDFHYSPNEESNSIAVIIQHMSGNMLSRWTNFLEEDGEKEWRHRDTEFEIHPLTKQELLEIWNKGWTCMFSTLQALSDQDLERTIRIRHELMPAVDAINRQLAHYPYHVGQVIYIAKMIKNEQWKSLTIPRKKT